MARPIRVLYPGALYHVIARGNEKQSIFLSDQDRKKFLVWLSKVAKDHNLIVYAYCLMDNHYHLLVETPDGNLSTAMQDLNSSYSQWFNVIHDRVGHLFQGRFKSFLIEKEPYLLEVSRYIVLNPVEAGLVKHPRNWKWSSYNHTSGSAFAPKWLHVDWLLGNFSSNKQNAQKEYRRFVTEGIDVSSPYVEVEHDFILGTPQFVHWVWDNHTAGSETIREYPREQRIVGRLTLEEIFVEEMTSEQRTESILFARFRCGYLLSEIGRHLNLDRSTISKICKQNSPTKT